MPLAAIVSKADASPPVTDRGDFGQPVPDIALDQHAGP
jgi:hypothetical protein